MSTEDTRESGRADAPAVEPKNEPEVRDPKIITDADRAANPFGAARRDREANRDEGGRFAPKPDEQHDGKQAKSKGQGDGDKPDAREPQDRQQSGQVPHAALAAERGKRQAAADENAGLRQQLDRMGRELAELRGTVAGQRPPPAAPPKTPEFWENPGAAVDHRLREAMSPMQAAMMQQRLGFSQAMATQQHGPDAVRSALAAAGELRSTNPAEHQRLEAMVESSFDPVGDVVRWHKQTSAMREIGDDPAAYRERLRQELLAEMGLQGGDDHQQHAPPAAQRQPVRTGPFPSSFAAQPSGGPRGGPAYGGPRSLEQLMGR